MLPGIRGVIGKRVLSPPGSILVAVSGAYNFLVPDFDMLLIELWGPGASGSSGGFEWVGYLQPKPGIGGGGGGYCAKTYRSQAFVPGSLLAAVVGSPGIDTTVAGAALIARGGEGSSGGTASGGDTNATGGAAWGSIGGPGANGGPQGTAPGGGGHGAPGWETPGLGAIGQLKFTWA